MGAVEVKNLTQSKKMYLWFLLVHKANAFLIKKLSLTHWTVTQDSGLLSMIYFFRALETCFRKANLLEHTSSPLHMKGAIISWERFMCYLNNPFSVHSCFSFHLTLNCLQWHFSRIISNSVLTQSKCASLN